MSRSLRIDWNSRATVADIGYWIGAPYWSNGYAKRAGRAIIDRARQLGVETIILKYFDQTTPRDGSQRKLGLRGEAARNVEYPLDGKRLTVHRTGWRSPRAEGCFSVEAGDRRCDLAAAGATFGRRGVWSQRESWRRRSRGLGVDLVHGLPDLFLEARYSGH